MQQENDKDPEPSFVRTFAAAAIAVALFAMAAAAVTWQPGRDADEHERPPPDAPPGVAFESDLEIDELGLPRGTVFQVPTQFEVGFILDASYRVTGGPYQGRACQPVYVKVDPSDRAIVVPAIIVVEAGGEPVGLPDHHVVVGVELTKEALAAVSTAPHGPSFDDFSDWWPTDDVASTRAATGRKVSYEQAGLRQVVRDHVVGAVHSVARSPLRDELLGDVHALHQHVANQLHGSGLVVVPGLTQVNPEPLDPYDLKRLALQARVPAAGGREVRAIPGRTPQSVFDGLHACNHLN